jgi:hypothetical protein
MDGWMDGWMDGRTGGRTDITKVIVVFRSSANTPTNEGTTLFSNVGSVVIASQRHISKIRTLDISCPETLNLTQYTFFYCKGTTIQKTTENGRLLSSNLHPLIINCKC